MENTLNTLNRLISGAFNDISRVEQKAIKDSGLTDVSVNEAHTVDAIGLYVPKTMSAVAEKLEITMGTLMSLFKVFKVFSTQKSLLFIKSLIFKVYHFYP